MDAEKDKSYDNLRNLTGKVSIPKAIPFAFQQVLAMFITNLVPIIMVAGPYVSSQEILSLTQNAMIVAGIATLIQATPMWKIGSGLPIYMGVSFTFVVALVSVAAHHGYGAVVGAVIVGGLIEGFLGLSAKFWKKVIEPIVAATVVTGIGLSLLSTATRSFGGGYVEEFGSIPYLVTGTVTIVACLLWQVKFKGNAKQLAILIGIAAGYLCALCFGLVVFPDFSELKIFALPKILPVKPEFYLDSIITVGIIFLVSATETIGDVSAIANGALHRRATPDEVVGALTTDGFCSSLAGLGGVTPITSYSENIGITIMTGVVNRNVARIGAIFMIVCGLFPPVGYIVRTIPSSVIGGVMLIVLGQILVSGFEMMSTAGFTNRNRLIASLSLAVGVGFTATSEAGIWSSMPYFIQAIFSQNIVAIIFVMALLLSLVLPKDMDEDTEKTDVQD